MEKIKHLKLDFSLLLLNVMVGPSQLELEFRITRKLRATRPSGGGGGGGWRVSWAATVLYHSFVNWDLPWHCSSAAVMG